jgi:hypothetical protein
MYWGDYIAIAILFSVSAFLLGILYSNKRK